MGNGPVVECISVFMDCIKQKKSNICVIFIYHRQNHLKSFELLSKKIKYVMFSILRAKMQANLGLTTAAAVLVFYRVIFRSCSL